jgi:hypothetical protein
MLRGPLLLVMLIGSKLCVSITVVASVPSTRERIASSFECLVGNCYIRNLCVDDRGRYLYFLDWPHETTALNHLFLHPGARNLHGSKLQVEVMNGTIDLERFKMATGVHIAIDRLYIPYVQGLPNAGHTLADEVVSIFRALEMWELLTEPVHVYLNNVRHNSCCMSVYECAHACMGHYNAFGTFIGTLPSNPIVHRLSSQRSTTFSPWPDRQCYAPRLRARRAIDTL